MANNKLFPNFKNTDTQTWEDVITKDLKGADYNKKLVTKTIEGFSILPYYRDEHLGSLSYLDSNPGFFPFMRTNNEKAAKHKIQQTIVVDSYIDANNKALNFIKKGITSIEFDFVTKESVLQNDISILLRHINLSSIQIILSSEKLSEQLSKILIEFLKLNRFTNVDVSISFDPISFKTISGYFIEKDFKATFKNIYYNTKDIGGINIVNINAYNFRNAGSSAVQEIAYSLSIATEYLSIANDLSFNIDKFITQISFTFGIGSNYFMEIAKLRAARYLWAKILEVFGIKDNEQAKMKVNSITSDWNKTAYDPYVNVLRTTTEAMSAIIGGTDSLLVKPFNSSYQESSDFSERIARNIQIILNEEAYFDKFIDPAGGSYYIENLTNSIIENSWKLFLEIEDEGGYINAFDKGIIKKNIEKVSSKRDMDIAMKKEVLLGTNQYPAQGETALIKKKKSSINKNAIRLYRGAEAFEELRQNTEKQEKTPNVLLIKYGNLTMRKARASFATNFFACAGFNIIEEDVITSLEEAVVIYKKNKGDIVVLCSSDDEYNDFAKELYNIVKMDSIFTIAGYPKKQIEDFNSVGINNFIHVKSNILETLKGFQDILFKK